MDQKEALLKLDDVLDQWISTPMGRRTFLASLPLLMTACATEQHRQREGNLRGDETTLTYEEERNLTKEALPQMRKDYPAVQNPQLQSYISQLGKKIVAANNLQGNPYSYNFTVVDVGYVNAFALPAGTIFVTAPLIAMADSEAELAGVIGHEVGHVKARHTAQRMEAAKKAEGKSWIYAAGGGILGGALGYGLGKLLCAPSDDQCMQKATMYGAAAGAGGGLLVQKYAFMANSREDEMEADRIGFRTSVAAGYDKDKVGLFYEKLLKMEEQAKGQHNQMLSSLADAMSTHPPSRERVTQMNQMAAEQRGNSRAIVSSKEFDRMKGLCSELAKRKQQKTG
ncbi:M48 family metalloprotease [Bdellovibrio sp. ArHS]|uniref:M48 family metalloprotease n=1 Tax=Bdellovibrio sp. ArHS TaxID=1569284 RepID=UPI000A86FD7A|nr:M48 family metalloprotease [Bdellovibrio sp. ArHS]